MAKTLTERFGLAAFRRLTVLQRITVLALLGLVVALLLTAVRSVWSFAVLMDARRRGPAEACPDLAETARPDEIEIVGDGLWGYSCEASTVDGFAEQTGTVDTSLLFVFSLALVAASAVTLLGVFIAVIVRGVIRLFVDSPDRPLTRWGIILITTACLLAPWTYLLLYVQWYAASNSGGGTLCPSEADGEEVLGFSVEASPFPPLVTCTGDTVGGTEFSVSDYGLAYDVFIAVVVFALLGVALLIASRFVSSARRAPR